MKITNDMIHEDLRSQLGILRLLPVLLSKKWSAKLVDYAIRKQYKGRFFEDISVEEMYVPSSEEHHSIRVKVYRPKEVSDRLPIMLYIHGGGYIIGNPEQFETIIEGYIKKKPCIVISPDYRLAPDHPYPAGFNDCYDTLLWAKEHKDKLHSTGEFIVAGHSAGGGLTAAVTLKARDTKDVNIAFQMPIYPMIDDLQVSDPKRHMITPCWDSRSNAFGWASYLKNLDEIPAYAAPARNNDYTDFPPTITFVGNIEPFYQETVDYVSRLKAAEIDVMFKEYDKCFHGFDLIGQSNISKDALKFTFDSYGTFYERYIR